MKSTERIEQELRGADQAVGAARSEYIRAARTRSRVYAKAAKKMSQRQIAEIVGTSQQRVGQIIDLTKRDA